MDIKFYICVTIIKYMITQIGIMVFGAAAIWFVGRKESWKRWGYVLGLLSQPFWIISSIDNEQWGILVMTLFYLYSWGQGFYNHWIKYTQNDATIYYESGDGLKELLIEDLPNNFTKADIVKRLNNHEAFEIKEPTTNRV